MRHATLYGLLFACLLAFPVVSSAESYQLTVQTSDCNGDSGMTSIPIGAVYKIQSFQCDNSKEGARKQILIRSRRQESNRITGPWGSSGSVTSSYDSYDAVLVTEEEAKRIQHEINNYMAARKKNLEQGKTIILEH